MYFIPLTSWSHFCWSRSWSWMVGSRFALSFCFCPRDWLLGHFYAASFRVSTHKPTYVAGFLAVIYYAARSRWQMAPNTETSCQNVHTNGRRKLGRWAMSLLRLRSCHFPVFIFGTFKRSYLSSPGTVHFMFQNNMTAHAADRHILLRAERTLPQGC